MAALHEVDIFSTPIPAARYIIIAGKSPQSKVRPLWKLCTASQPCTTRVRGQICYSKLGPCLSSGFCYWPELVPVAIWIHYFGVNNPNRCWIESGRTHPTPGRFCVRSVLFFALVCSLWYQEGKPPGCLCLLAGSNMRIPCPQRAVQGYSEAARKRRRPLGWADSYMHHANRREHSLMAQ